MAAVPRNPAARCYDSRFPINLGLVLTQSSKSRALPAPFAVIRAAVELSDRKGQSVVNASYDAFLALLKRFLIDIDVDEAWYLGQNEDVATAIKAGRFKSAKQHYVDNGFFEGRLPFLMRVDERWHLQQNPDVAEFIRRGNVASAQAHFNENGYKEGRLPFDLSG